MQPEHVHFVAIGGTGMGSLAGLLGRRGIHVTGSDRKLYPPMSEKLAEWGIEVDPGFRAENVLEREPDLVVIGNAVRPDNPEARAVLDHAIPHLSFPDALFELAMRGKRRIVVCGTHGKTTTTSMIAAMLSELERDPSFLVGGIPIDFGESFHEGEGDDFVVEGDEYDTAFFDKTPKFLHYGADIAVITSVEFDHADIYRDLDHVKEAFRALVAGMPPDGVIVANADSADVMDVVSEAPCRVLTYGIAPAGTDPDAPPHAQIVAREIAIGAAGTRFELHVAADAAGAGDAAQGLRCSCSIQQTGVFNVANALAALGVAHALGVPVALAALAAGRFRGVKRRMEVRGVAGGVVILDDFAHHPTAVAGTVEAARARFGERRLVAVFEPRSNTSRRALFQQAYAEAFGPADTVVVRRVGDEPIYSATGEVAERFSADRLVQDLHAQGKRAIALSDVDEIVDFVRSEAGRGDVVLVMSNGGFDGIFEKLFAALGGAEPGGLEGLLDAEEAERRRRQREALARRPNPYARD